MTGQTPPEGQQEATDLDAVRQLARVRRTAITRRVSAVAAVVLAVVLLASALSPPLTQRLELLLEVLPFQALHVAATTTIFAAAALAMTARGLWHGHRLAWMVALVTLFAAVVFNLIKGLDVEEGLISLALGGWLIYRRRDFAVMPGRAQVRLALIATGAAFVSSVVVATLLVLTLGRDQHPRPIETARAAAERLGGRQQLPLVELNPVLTPLLTALGVAIVVAGLWLLLSPRWRVQPTAAEHHADRERARAILATHGGGTLGYFALRDDKDWFFTGDSVVAYAVRGGVCLVSPDPIGPWGDRYQVWADFTDFVSMHGWAVAVVGASNDWLGVYRMAGLRPTYLGDEAVVDVAGFSLAGKSMKGLRQAVTRIERAGVSANFLDPAAATAQQREAVLRIAESSRRGEAERGFSMTLSRLFDPDDTGLLLVTATNEQGRVLGFIQWIPAAHLPGWSLDVMRRDTDADIPNGVTDFLIVKTLEHIAAQGSRGLGLNFAVLRETMNAEPSTRVEVLTRKVLDVVAEHSQLESLGRFNEKYHPRWEARYVARGDGSQLVGQALAVARAEGLIDLPGR